MKTIRAGISSALADIDWLTALTESPVDGRLLRSISEQWFVQATRLLPWAMRGYRGRRANELEHIDGGLAYGERLAETDVSYLLQAWGPVAVKIIAQVLAAQHYRISRMDYAVTVLFDEPLPPVIKWDVPNVADRRFQVTRIVPTDDGGGTLYVGSRGSDKFGRIYDKGAQLGTIPARFYWRWEVEYKGQSAKQSFGNYLGRREPEERAAFVKDEVACYYSEHGMPFPVIPGQLLGKSVVRYASRILCDSTTLQWMQQQVQPALRRLAASGKLEQALEALGVVGGTLLPSQSEIERSDGKIQYDFLVDLQRAGTSGLLTETDSGGILT